MVPMREMVSEQIKSFPKSTSLGKKYASALQISNCAVAWTGDNRKKSKAKEKKNHAKMIKAKNRPPQMPPPLTYLEGCAT